MHFEVEEVSADGWNKRVVHAFNSSDAEIIVLEAVFGNIKASVMSLPLIGEFAWTVTALNWSAEGKETDVDEAKRKAEAVAIALGD